MATNKYITNIIPTVAPRLPAAPSEYNPVFIEQYSNILRIYFNGIDTTFTGILGEPQAKTPNHPGGGYLSFPYAAVQRTTNKTFTANTATLVTFDQNDYLNDCTNSGSDGIVVKTAGIYNYQFSVQLANPDTKINTAYVWLQVNGVDVSGTGSKFDCPAKHGTSDGYLIAACNFYVKLNAGDHVDLYAAVSDANLYMEAYTAQALPFPMPSIPSVVATLSFVSRLPT